ncbi:E3 ubiquitin-protein ligase rififylin isoform X3 [Elephas maximus indicus]|uniref:E3 ubiquitin-protein ligase rififylin isoform X3 n=1 Tax=Elephas maximus indicus TaxID=99487 RepID=UPI002115E8A5|nr:E3 ubiquitin-protein ligase rififylin isoform X3 [Elephas maximus indicus]
MLLNPVQHCSWKVVMRISTRDNCLAPDVRVCWGPDFIMWATCCNWFCLDGQPEDAPPPQGARTQAYSNPGYSSFPSPTGSEPSCKGCGAHFANAARKQTCLDCKKNFCMTCSSQVGNGPRLCLLCQRFRATAFQREELMKMKVKDLRDYLSLHDISTEMCREKEELVFLVLDQQPVIPQANGHVSQDQEEPVYLESTARVPAEEETQSLDSEDSFVPGRRASLSDLTNVEDIEALTVRQLKEILARNFVNYKGCCEKWELMERVTWLYKDQKGLQHLEGAASPGLEENLCKICMDSPIDCVLLECGHMVTCTKCGKRMNECPICRQYVIRAVHVFRS